MNSRNIALDRQKCLPCEGDIAALSMKEIKTYLRSLRNWSFSRKERAIRAEYRMKNFLAAVKKIQKIARIAEKENHHPDLHLTGYRHLAVVLKTHAIDGLSINDFILASKIQKLFRSFPSPK